MQTIKKNSVTKLTGNLWKKRIFFKKKLHFQSCRYWNKKMITTLNLFNALFWESFLFFPSTIPNNTVKIKQDVIESRNKKNKIFFYEKRKNYFQNKKKRKKFLFVKKVKYKIGNSPFNQKTKGVRIKWKYANKTKQNSNNLKKVIKKTRKLFYFQFFKNYINNFPYYKSAFVKKIKRSWLLKRRIDQIKKVDTAKGLTFFQNREKFALKYQGNNKPFSSVKRKQLYRQFFRNLFFTVFFKKLVMKPIKFLKFCQPVSKLKFFFSEPNFYSTLGIKGKTYRFYKKKKRYKKLLKTITTNENPRLSSVSNRYFYRHIQQKYRKIFKFWTFFTNWQLKKKQRFQTPAIGINKIVFPFSIRLNKQFFKYKNNVVLRNLENRWKTASNKAPKTTFFFIGQFFKKCNYTFTLEYRFINVLQPIAKTPVLVNWRKNFAQKFLKIVLKNNGLINNVSKLMKKLLSVKMQFFSFIFKIQTKIITSKFINNFQIKFLKLNKNQPILKYNLQKLNFFLLKPITNFHLFQLVPSQWLKSRGTDLNTQIPSIFKFPLSYLFFNIKFFDQLRNLIFVRQKKKSPTYKISTFFNVFFRFCFFTTHDISNRYHVQLKTSSSRTQFIQLRFWQKKIFKNFNFSRTAVAVKKWIKWFRGKQKQKFMLYNFIKFTYRLKNKYTLLTKNTKNFLGFDKQFFRLPLKKKLSLSKRRILFTQQIRKVLFFNFPTNCEISFKNEFLNLIINRKRIFKYSTKAKKRLFGSISEKYKKTIIKIKHNKILNIIKNLHNCMVLFKNRIFLEMPRKKNKYFYLKCNTIQVERKKKVNKKNYISFFLTKYCFLKPKKYIMRTIKQKQFLFLWRKYFKNLKKLVKQLKKTRKSKSFKFYQKFFKQHKNFIIIFFKRKKKVLHINSLKKNFFFSRIKLTLSFMRNKIKNIINHSVKQLYVTRTLTKYRFFFNVSRESVCENKKYLYIKPFCSAKSFPSYSKKEIKNPNKIINIPYKIINCTKMKKKKLKKLIVKFSKMVSTRKIVVHHAKQSKFARKKKMPILLVKHINNFFVKIKSMFQKVRCYKSSRNKKNVKRQTINILQYFYYRKYKKLRKLRKKIKILLKKKSTIFSRLKIFFLPFLMPILNSKKTQTKSPARYQIRKILHFFLSTTLLGYKKRQISTLVKKRSFFFSPNLKLGFSVTTSSWFFRFITFFCKKKKQQPKIAPKVTKIFGLPANKKKNMQNIQATCKMFLLYKNIYIEKFSPFLFNELLIDYLLTNFLIKQNKNVHFSYKLNKFVVLHCLLFLSDNLDNIFKNYAKNYIFSKKIYIILTFSVKKQIQNFLLFIAKTYTQQCIVHFYKKLNFYRIFNVFKKTSLKNQHFQYLAKLKNFIYSQNKSNNIRKERIINLKWLQKPQKKSCEKTNTQTKVRKANTQKLKHLTRSQ